MASYCLCVKSNYLIKHVYLTAQIIYGSTVMESCPKFKHVHGFSIFTRTIFIIHPLSAC